MTLIFKRFIVVFVVFLPFLINPLGKLGFSVFPKDSVKFFVSVIDKAMSERRGIENVSRFVCEGLILIAF